MRTIAPVLTHSGLQGRDCFILRGAIFGMRVVPIPRRSALAWRLLGFAGIGALVLAASVEGLQSRLPDSLTVLIAIAAMLAGFSYQPASEQGWLVEALTNAGPLAVYSSEDYAAAVATANQLAEQLFSSAGRN